jgi:hypothetical protein
MGQKMRRNPRFDFFLGFDAGLKSFSPPTSRVKSVPRRSLLLMPAGTRIVVPKSIDQHIPERLESLNKQRLRKGNPDVIHYKITALKVTILQIGGLLNGIGMLRKPIE